MKKYNHSIFLTKNSKLLLMVGLCILTFSSCKKNKETESKQEKTEEVVKVNPIDAFLNKFETAVNKQTDLYVKLSKGEEEHSKAFNAVSEEVTRLVSEGYGLDLGDFTDEQKARLKEIQARYSQIVGEGE
ncbi:hypothetical protein GJV76_05130 [Myroides sp. BIT-d1]|uniref:Uncharacterized protein n=1 Tax=Myroides albus TaxID=2562892 RepID=A0A6I3LLU7_9FLAO|nr:hypothetical protein [Myroides albus]MTG97521.1 hypothetical protein [Myroides albus]